MVQNPSELVLPPSRREEAVRTDAPLPWEGDALGSAPELWAGMPHGGYPELVASPDRDLMLWHAGYAGDAITR